MQTARGVRAAGAALVRGGAYKPRTSPYSFQGLEEEGLQYMKEAPRRNRLRRDLRGYQRARHRKCRKVR